jgi:hypothetical protein
MRFEVRVEAPPQHAGEIDDSDIHLVETPGAYALWPARAEKKIQTPPGHRRKREPDSC